MPVLSATVYPTLAYVLLRADWSGTVVRDTFTRTTANGFGTADTGQLWSVSGGAVGDYSTGPFGPNFVATISNGTVNVVRFASVPFGFNDAEVLVQGINFGTDIALTNAISVWVFARSTDINNSYTAQLRLETTGSVLLRIQKRVAGVLTTIAGPFTIATTNLALTRYNVRLSVVGSRILAKAWLSSAPEPTEYQLGATDTDLVTGTLVGLMERLEAGNTNTLPVITNFDTFTAFNPGAISADCAIVTRRNTVTGEVVQLRPYIFYDSSGALMLECGMGLWWDTEPPLNVPLEYCTYPCDSGVVVSANPTFESGTAGWTATGGAITQDCTVSKFGACSARLTPSGTNFEPLISQTGFALTPGLETTMSAWVRSSTGWNAVRLVLSIVYTDATVETVSTPVEILDDTEWRYLSVTFTPRTTTSSVTMSFVAQGTPAAGNLFNIDEFQVSQLTATAAASSCVTVTVASENVWLKSPLHPCLDVAVGICDPMLLDCEETDRVSYVGTFDDNYAPNTVLLSPVNRKYPIPVNRIRRAPTATLRLLAHDCDAKDAVLAINDPGDPLLFQAPADYCIPDRYISVGALDETRFSVDQRDDFRLMTLPYATVERPEGPADGICGARIADLCDIYTSWSALAAAGLTWTDLLLGEASPNGPGQPTPPAGARTWGDVETEFVNWLAVEAGGTRDWGELRDGL